MSYNYMTHVQVARLKSQLEARINEDHRSRSVEPTRSASPSPMVRIILSRPLSPVLM
jgi:hypothetical protein